MDIGISNITGVGRSVITTHNGNLYLTLPTSGLQTIYSFNSALDPIGTITISQIAPYQAIRGMTFINDDLYVLNYSTQELYKYAPVPIPGAVWLLSSGLIGLIAIRRKLKK